VHFYNRESLKNMKKQVAYAVAMVNRAKKTFGHGKLGSGSRFKHCTQSMAHRKGIKTPKALCAAIGARAYGKQGMARMAAAGRRRATA
jgi:hypothetical protein